MTDRPAVDTDATADGSGGREFQDRLGSHRNREPRRDASL
ncbi:hypothetical protein A7982_12480 [Minicystis rosea]|nr:hypothetical protein A7982_12480 [Minicystis rosea]